MSTRPRRNRSAGTSLADWAIGAQPDLRRGRQQTRVHFTELPGPTSTETAAAWMALHRSIPDDVRPAHVDTPAEGAPLVFWRLVRGRLPVAISADYFTTVEAARRSMRSVQAAAHELVLHARTDMGAGSVTITDWFATLDDVSVLRSLPNARLLRSEPGEPSLLDALQAADLEPYVHRPQPDEVMRTLRRERTQTSEQT